MKRLLFALALLSYIVDVRAQVENLDEEKLQGAWKASVIDGAFDNVKNENSYSVPNGLILTDGNYTQITFLDGYPVFYKGYWLSSGSTGKYYLHLLPWDGGKPIVNFRVVSFENDKMVVTTYDGRGTLYLTKDMSANVRAVSADTTPNSKTYTITGAAASDSAKGVLIQGGKKIIK